MTTRQKRAIGLTLVVLLVWEVLSSLAFAYAVPAIAAWGRPYGYMLWFGRFSVPPNPYWGVLQYLTPLIHFRLPSPAAWRAIQLACCIGALGPVLAYLLWLRMSWAGRYRSRVSRLSHGQKPRPIERSDDDNHGHAKLMEPATACETFPAAAGKLVGMNPDGTLLWDECYNTSGISLEFIGTRGWKSSRACTMIWGWAVRFGKPMWVFDTAYELGHMTWRMLTAAGKRVVILNPNPEPTDDDGNVYPWAPFIEQTNIIGWIDIHDHEAEIDVHTMTGLFFDDEGVAKTQSGQFFEGTAESLMACILAHVLWSAEPVEVSREEIIQILRGELSGGIGFDELGEEFQDELVMARADQSPKLPPLPGNLRAVRRYLSMPADDLRTFLFAVAKHSPSGIARHYGRQLCQAHPETFTDIYQTCAKATKWLAVEALADMVCGDGFKVTDVSRDNDLVLFVQPSMTSCLNFPNLANVLFGAFLAAKIKSPGDTFPLVQTDESWLLKGVQAIRQTILNGGKYRIALHMFWQSIGDLDRIWGRDSRKSFFDGAAWVALGPMGDIQSAREVSEACGSYGAIGYSQGDNASTQAGASIWARWSRGSNLNRHPIKRWVFYSHELMQDLDRRVRLILRLKQPLIVGTASYKDVPGLAAWIDPSPYDYPRTAKTPWYNIFLRRRGVPVRSVA